VFRVTRSGDCAPVRIAIRSRGRTTGRPGSRSPTLASIAVADQHRATVELDQDLAGEAEHSRASPSRQARHIALCFLLRPPKPYAIPKALMPLKITQHKRVLFSSHHLHPAELLLD